jgi:hypothetical protein
METVPGVPASAPIPRTVTPPVPVIVFVPMLRSPDDVNLFGAATTSLPDVYARTVEGYTPAAAWVRTGSTYSALAAAAVTGVLVAFKMMLLAACDAAAALAPMAIALAPCD